MLISQTLDATVQPILNGITAVSLPRRCFFGALVIRHDLNFCVCARSTNVSPGYGTVVCSITADWNNNFGVIYTRIVEMNQIWDTLTIIVICAGNTDSACHQIWWLLVVVHDIPVHNICAIQWFPLELVWNLKFSLLIRGELLAWVGDGFTKQLVMGCVHCSLESKVDYLTGTM